MLTANAREEKENMTAKLKNRRASNAKTPAEDAELPLMLSVETASEPRRVNHNEQQGSSSPQCGHASDLVMALPTVLQLVVPVEV